MLKRFCHNPEAGAECELKDHSVIARSPLIGDQALDDNLLLRDLLLDAPPYIHKADCGEDGRPATANVILDAILAPGTILSSETMRIARGESHSLLTGERLSLDYLAVASDWLALTDARTRLKRSLASPVTIVHVDYELPRSEEGSRRTRSAARHGTFQGSPCFREICCDSSKDGDRIAALGGVKDIVKTRRTIAAMPQASDVAQTARTIRLLSGLITAACYAVAAVVAADNLEACSGGDGGQARADIEAFADHEDPAGDTSHLPLSEVDGDLLGLPALRILGSVEVLLHAGLHRQADGSVTRPSAAGLADAGAGAGASAVPGAAVGGAGAGAAVAIAGAAVAGGAVARFSVGELVEVYLGTSPRSTHISSTRLRCGATPAPARAAANLCAAT